MRVFLQSACQSGRLGGALSSMLLDHFPNVAPSQDEADVVIVPIDRMPDYKFNQALYGITKPWVLLDYFECEWNFFERRSDSLLFGINGLSNMEWLDDEWLLFSRFAAAYPPMVYFKRELLAKDRVDVHPIDWVCCQEIPQLMSRDQFLSRPIELLFGPWGYSNPLRPQLHGDIFRAMADQGIEVHDIIDSEVTTIARHWFTIYAPHWRRIHINNIMELQQQAKLSIALPGAGIKTFRDAECPIGCIPVFTKDLLARAYPWEHGENCLRLPTDDYSLIPHLDAFTKRTDLYEIYLASQETIRKYQSKVYIENYITPIIESAL